jgi:hypothetical protein
MTAMDVYELLDKAGVSFEVVEIFEGARLLRIDVFEEDVEEVYDEYGVNTKNSFNTRG